MKLKPLLILVAVLAAASIVTFFVQRRGPAVATDARVGQVLVTTAQIQQASRIRITDSGRSVVLTKPEGGAWIVPTYHNFPASFTKIQDFLADFVNTKVERVVSTNPERIARLDFRDSRVELLDAADKVTWSLTLGRSDNGGHFVRFGDEPKAYFAPFRPYLDTEPLNWADQQLLKLTADEIKTVELTFPRENTTVVATRAKKEDPFAATAGAPGGRKLRFDALPTLVNSFVTLRFSHTSEPGLAEAQAVRADTLRTLKLTTFAGQTYTIEVAAKIPPPRQVDPPADGSPPPPPDPRDSIPTAVYVWVSSSLESAPVNALMKQRTFHMNEYLFGTLPAKVEDLFEAPAGATVNQPAGP